MLCGPILYSLVMQIIFLETIRSKEIICIATRYRKQHLSASPINFLTADFTGTRSFFYDDHYAMILCVGYYPFSFIRSRVSNRHPWRPIKRIETAEPLVAAHPIEDLKQVFYPVLVYIYAHRDAYTDVSLRFSLTHFYGTTSWRK